MKKFILVKTSEMSDPQQVAFHKTSVIVSAKNMNIINNNVNNSQPRQSGICTRRRSMQAAYKDLLHAISLLPDKQLQDRLLKAIDNNEKPICSKCHNSMTPPLMQSAATQTEEQISDCKINLQSPSLHRSNNQGNENHDNESPTLKSPIEVSSSSKQPEASPPVSEADSPNPQQRRKRKRKVCLPQVLKKSTVQLLHEQQKPKMENKKKKTQQLVEQNKNVNDLSENTSELPPINKRPRCDSTTNILMSLVETIDLDSMPPEPMTKNDFIVHTMACEYLDSGILQDGLLPIHIAIEKNDLKTLQRQIFVWKILRKTDLNELLTNAEEDCLQLAISNRCEHGIISCLLDAGLDTKALDEASNTIMHMALLNNIKAESLSLLLERIDDLSLLLKFNDDGYTPLQLAVRLDAFLLAEVMLNALDRRLFGKQTFSRALNHNRAAETDAAAMSKVFKKFYEDRCEELEKFAILKPSDRYTLKEIRLKQQIMDIGEMKSGNTSLFHAIENKMEHFIYFLLAHQVNPCVTNHSGQDARSYFGENAKLLNLTLKIDKAMEKVANLLENA